MPDVAEAAWTAASTIQSRPSPSRSAPRAEAMPAPDLSGSSMLAYAALRGEPNLDSCIDRFLAAGGRVYLPVVTEVGRPLVFGEVRESIRTLQPKGRWGIREPEPQLSAAELMSAEVGLGLVFVPALGFGEGGARLGNGGGFYDRTFGPMGEVPLADSAHQTAIFGVCFDEEIGLDGLHVEPWDLRITRAVTEAGLHSFQ